MAVRRGAPEPWDRMPREGARAFEAFVAYRDMGPARSTAKVAKQLGKSKALMDQWSSKWSWVARTRAWDEEQDHLTKIGQEKRRRETMERHAQLGKLLQSRGLEILQSFEAAAKKDAATWNDVVRLITEGVKLERLAMGEITENVKQTLGTEEGTIIRVTIGGKGAETDANDQH